MFEMYVRTYSTIESEIKPAPPSKDTAHNNKGNHPNLQMIYSVQLSIQYTQYRIFGVCMALGSHKSFPDAPMRFHRILPFHTLGLRQIYVVIDIFDPAATTRPCVVFGREKRSVPKRARLLQYRSVRAIHPCKSLLVAVRFRCSRCRAVPVLYHHPLCY